MNSKSNPLTPDSLIVQEAIAWMVKLQSGIASIDDLSNCEQWRQQNPLHEQAWRQLESLSSNFKTIPSLVAHAALEQPAANLHFNNRRLALKSLLMLVGAGSLAYSGYQYAPWQQMVADYSTEVGKQSTVKLADGSSLLMNTDSAIDIHFDDQQRLVKLLKGEVLITTGHQLGEHRPFSIQTAQGNVRALGTRFLVRQQESSTLVAVYESAVEVRTKIAQMTTRVDTNQQLTFTDLQASNIVQADQDLTAWADGVIVARNMRLADFANEIDRYRTGKILCDSSAAELLISGVFPIHDPARVLETLQRTLPIQVETRMFYWTMLTAITP